MTKTLFILAFLPLLVACSTQPVGNFSRSGGDVLNRSAQATATTQSGSALPTSGAIGGNSTFGSLYILNEYSNRKEPYIVYANEERWGQIANRQYVAMKVTPGSHSFRINAATDSSASRDGELIAVFDLDIKAGAMAIVHCAEVMGRSPLYLVSHDKCTAGTDAQQRQIGGVTICEKPELVTKEVKWHGVVYTKEELMNCQITDNRQFLTNMSLVNTAKTLLSNDGEQADDYESYKSFITKYPQSKFYQQAYDRYRYLESINDRQKLGQQIEERLNKDDRLSLQAKKDKYMITLTNQLMSQQFDSAIFYFELLDHMNVELSSSFDFFGVKPC